MIAAAPEPQAAPVEVAPAASPAPAPAPEPIVEQPAEQKVDEITAVEQPTAEAPTVEQPEVDPSTVATPLQVEQPSNVADIVDVVVVDENTSVANETNNTAITNTPIAHDTIDTQKTEEEEKNDVVIEEVEDDEEEDEEEEDDEEVDAEPIKPEVEATLTFKVAAKKSPSPLPAEEKVTETVTIADAGPASDDEAESDASDSSSDDEPAAVAKQPSVTAVVATAAAAAVAPSVSPPNTNTQAPTQATPSQAPPPTPTQPIAQPEYKPTTTNTTSTVWFILSVHLCIYIRCLSVCPILSMSSHILCLTIPSSFSIASVIRRNTVQTNNSHTWFHFSYRIRIVDILHTNWTILHTTAGRCANCGGANRRGEPEELAEGDYQRHGPRDRTRRTATAATAADDLDDNDEQLQQQQHVEHAAKDAAAARQRRRCEQQQCGRRVSASGAKRGLSLGGLQIVVWLGYRSVPERSILSPGEWFLSPTNSSLFEKCQQISELYKFEFLLI